MSSHRGLRTLSVDTFKRAVRGLTRRRSTPEWSHPRGQAIQEPKDVAVRRVSRRARQCAGLALTLYGFAAWAQGYGLLTTAAPDFALHGFAGDNIRLSEHRGEVVVLTFWSSRCGPCARQLEILNRSFATYHSAGLSMYGVGVDDDPRRAREFVDAHRVSFQMLTDPQKDVSRLYQVDNLPMTVLIDRGGIVRRVFRDFGPRDEALYLRELRELLNE
jgi:peroxiredoxin